MPRQNNTQQRLLQSALGLPLGATKKERQDFISEHNQGLTLGTQRRLDSELKTLTDKDIRAIIAPEIIRFYAYSKDAPLRAWNDLLTLARHVRKGQRP